MHGIDIIACALAALFVILGIKRGLITELFRLLAMVGGFVAATLYYRALCSRLSFLHLHDSVRLVVAYLCVYVLAAGALVAVGWTIRKIVHWTMLGWADRLLGGLTGLCKAILIVWILIMTISTLPLPAVHAWLTKSIVFNAFKQLSPRLKLPDIDNAQQKILQAMDKETFNTFEDTRNRIDQFRTRIDSLTVNPDSI